MLAQPLLFGIVFVLPVAELVLFVLVATWIGFWWTLLLVAATAVLGLALVLSRGREQMSRVASSFRRGVFPGADLVDTALLAIAGLLLIVPGFITDAVGFALLAAPVRRSLRRLAGWKIGRRVGVW